MITGILIRKNQYFDSMFLMGVNDRISHLDGIQQTAVLMGSDANKEVLFDLGFESEQVKKTSANDLVIAISAASQEIVDGVFAHLDDWLQEVTTGRTSLDIHTLEDGVQAQPESNLVVISVPGEFAAHETKKSLKAGLNVFLFSDNVSLEDEITLKTLGSAKGLLVMGPDCGTSLIGGVGIGFANVVRRGNIGVIAASGTGLQEFSCLVHTAGYGISHGIGTGGRDLSDQVGGITTLAALGLLEQDPATKAITIISKPPGLNTLARVLERIKTCQKPVICCFLGLDSHLEGEGIHFQRADLLDEAVNLAISAIAESTTFTRPISQQTNFPQLPPGKFLRGIFAGGTFSYQAQQILRDAGIIVYSNAALNKQLVLENPNLSHGHTIVDMGDEFFLVGRPHPMINGSQRAKRIIKEGEDPSTGILLLDFVLGYNASMDPVGELIDAVQIAQSAAQKRGDQLTVVASICGTDNDPQDLPMQKQLLHNAGVHVFESSAQAAKFCAEMIRRSK